MGRRGKPNILSFFGYISYSELFRLPGINYYHFCIQLQTHMFILYFRNSMDGFVERLHLHYFCTKLPAHLQWSCLNEDRFKLHNILFLLMFWYFTIFFKCTNRNPQILVAILSVTVYVNKPTLTARSLLGSASNFLHCWTDFQTWHFLGTQFIFGLLCDMTTTNKWSPKRQSDT